MEIVIPHPFVVLSCIAAMGAGYILRWAIEEYTAIDIELAWRGQSRHRRVRRHQRGSGG